MLKNRFSFLLSCILFFTNVLINAQSIKDYNIIWDTQSKNSGESMPCGGGDIGMNVWVENGDLLFYFSRSGTFDENNTLLKLGRFRVRLDPNPLQAGTFSQKLNLEEGCIEITGKNGSLSTNIRVWVDVFRPVIHVDVANNKNINAEVFYESWRFDDRLIRAKEGNQCSYKWAIPEGQKTLKDEINFKGNDIVFYHHNQETTIFDVTVDDQGLKHVKDQIYNPLKNLTFGGKVQAAGMKPAGVQTGTYADTDYKAWKLESEKPLRSYQFNIYLHTEQTADMAQWEKNLQQVVANAEKDKKKAKEKSIQWWNDLWKKSFVFIQPNDHQSKAFEIGQNYQLFRYMLACNAYGTSPTKFNGGLFTYDPCFVDTSYRFTPDFRNWGGGTHTAQNQRLVYFPMIKNGDFDMLKSQFDFYTKILKTAELRSMVYWGHKGACFTEQMENFGLPNLSENKWLIRTEYPEPGVESNPWLEYEWDTVLEFCLMMLDEERYTGKDITEYIPFIESCVMFFDIHYQYLAMQRGSNALDGNKKLVLYPGSGCETYKMTTNASSTIAALKVILSRLLELNDHYVDAGKQEKFQQMLDRIPDIRTRSIENKEMIAPAWLWERINNEESPQLYPVYPWGIYGIGKPGLDIALNTWKYDPEVNKFKSHVGWKQDAIWAARLGLTEEAKGLAIRKMEKSATRFPAFWGPGFDWVPDHNWGGSGMIAIQEMLMQTDGDEIMLFPAWPLDWDVHFKMYAPYNTTVECKLKGGKIEMIKVSPESRKKDIKIINGSL